MRCWTLLAVLVMAYLSISYVSCKGGKSVRGMRRSTKSKYGFSGRPSSGLSLSRKKLLLAGAGLGAAYIGFQLASRDRNRLYDYTMCEGNRYEPNELGVYTNYRYTVCPRHLRYCCPDYDGIGYEGERCCDSSRYGYRQSRPTMLGSVFGTLLFIGMITLIIYCCCCKQRKKGQASPVIVTTPAQSSAPQGPMSGFKPYQQVPQTEPTPGVPGIYPPPTYSVFPFPGGGDDKCETPAPPYPTNPSVTPGSYPPPPGPGSCPSAMGGVGFAGPPTPNTAPPPPYPY